MQENTATHTTGATISGVVGIVLYLLIGFVYLTSGLVVPYPWLLVLWGLWVAGLYLLFVVFKGPRVWTPTVAIGAAAVWWIFVAVGESLLGWTA